MPPKKLPDEDSISLMVVHELLEQQKTFYKDLINQQENRFKDFVQMILDSSNKRLDGLTREVQDLKTSLQFTQNELDMLKQEHTQSSERLNSVGADLTSLQQTTLSVSTKLEYTENHSKRNNIIVDGIAESPNEKWAETEVKVRSLLSEKLKMDHRQIEIECVHRSGKPVPMGNKPRPITVKLLRHKDKLSILAKAKALKGSNVYINEDFTDTVRQKRRELLPEMKAARQRGDIAYLRYDKLIVHPPTHKPKTSGAMS